MRILERLEELFTLGGGPGANRAAYSPEEDAAHALAAEWMDAAGLDVQADAAGNLLGRRTGSRPELGELWCGSHLDSVPQGGRYDGALGVVAAIEALERLGPQERTVAVVAFRGEEVGCLGSRARCDEVGGLPERFVELHVEQGPRLARLGAPLAVVTGIVGYVRDELRCEGRAGHAGTTPMEDREDALVAAAERILALRDAARAIPDAVATVGQVAVEPGAGNVIPVVVRLSVDARAPDRERLDALVAAIGFEPALRVEPVAMDAAAVAAGREALAGLGVPVVELASGAGHDAGILAAAGVASGMLFVRSLAGGVSHSPDELSADEDVVLAVEALERTLRRLALA